MGTMDSFRRVAEASNTSADVMRFTCFVDYEAGIPFELLELGAGEINDELKHLIEQSKDTRTTILSVLEPLEKEGLVTINRETNMYFSTPEITKEIITEDET